MSAIRPIPAEGAEPAAETAPSAAQTPQRGLALLTNPRLRRALGVVTLSLLALVAGWWLRLRPFVSTDDARVAAPVVIVVPQGPGGRVINVLVREGQRVQAGQSLVELDSMAERAQVDRGHALVAFADARVGESEAQLELERQLSGAAEQRAHAGVRTAQAVRRRTVLGARAEELARARAEVTAAETLAAQARSDLERSASLSRGGAIATAALENATTTEAAVRASLDARRASLDLLEHGARPEDVSIAAGAVVQAQAGLVEADAGATRVGLRQRQLEEARAQAAQARAELALAEVALGRAILKSSVAGVVVRVSVDVGDSLASGQGAVTIVDLAHAWIAANIEETETHLLRVGQSVDITIDEGGELRGHVEVVTQAAASQFALIPSDNAAGNFTKVVQRIPIRVSLDDAAQAAALRVGQSVEVRIRVR